jgi:hypothetical protein
VVGKTSHPIVVTADHLDSAEEEPGQIPGTDEVPPLLELAQSGVLEKAGAVTLTLRLRSLWKSLVVALFILCSCLVEYLQLLF